MKTQEQHSIVYSIRLMLLRFRLLTWTFRFETLKTEKGEHHVNVKHMKKNVKSNL